MNKVLLYILTLVLLFIAGFYLFNWYIYNEKQAVVAKDHRDAEYVIEGVRIKLEGGISEIESAPGSASKTITKYFGNEGRKDLNGDGKEDVVFLVTQNTGGSGLFYYAVAALATENGYQGSEGILLGDRIAPQTTESGPGNSIIINYADRKVGENMTVAPSESKSLRLLLDPTSMQFGEVAQNFEGEADPSRMTLGMNKWVWIKTTMVDGKEILPKKADAFTLAFNQNNQLAFSTDCNGGGGIYTMTGFNVSFSQLVATEMACAGSQEKEFTTALQSTQKYSFTGRGELILEGKNGTTMTFR